MAGDNAALQKSGLLLIWQHKETNRLAPHEAPTAAGRDPVPSAPCFGMNGGSARTTSDWRADPPSQAHTDILLGFLASFTYLEGHRTPARIAPERPFGFQDTQP